MKEEWKRRVPDLVTASRFAAGVFLVADAFDRIASGAFLPVFFAAALSDVLDGFLARRLGVESDRGAAFDALADAFFYLCVAAAACYLYPDVILRYASPLIGLLFLQAASWIFSLVRFRRLTGYHTILAKTWGVLLFACCAGLFVFDSDLLLMPMIVIGCASLLEDIAITFILREARCSIPHVLAAIDLVKK